MRLLLASRHMRSSIRSSRATSSNRLVASSSLRSTAINSSHSSSSHVSQSSSTGVAAARGILGQRPTQRLFLLDSQTPTLRVSRTALGVELCSSALTLFSEGGVRSAEPNMLRGWDIGVDDDGG